MLHKPLPDNRYQLRHRIFEFWKQALKLFKKVGKDIMLHETGIT
jgi:hypothetical protein